MHNFIYTKSKINVKRFYIQKNRHFEKAGKFFVPVFKYKNPDTLRYAFFRGIFDIGGGGGAFLYAKTMHFALHFIFKK